MDCYVELSSGIWLYIGFCHLWIYDDDDSAGHWDTWKESVMITKTVTQFLAWTD